jgi:hypothetical protein
MCEGGRHIRSEELLAFEAGYRLSPSARLDLDLALFYHALLASRRAETIAKLIDYQQTEVQRGAYVELRLDPRQPTAR